jgi:hypothetical protein
MAIIGSVVIAYAFYRQVLGISANQGIINDILEAVRVIREQRGLVVESSTSPPLAETNS